LNIVDDEDDIDDKAVSKRHNYWDNGIQGIFVQQRIGLKFPLNLPVVEVVNRPKRAFQVAFRNYCLRARFMDWGIFVIEYELCESVRLGSLTCVFRGGCILSSYSTLVRFPVVPAAHCECSSSSGTPGMFPIVPRVN
jgi:hypothetical protein